MTFEPFLPLRAHEAPRRSALGARRGAHAALAAAADDADSGGECAREPAWLWRETLSGLPGPSAGGRRWGGAGAGAGSGDAGQWEGDGLGGGALDGGGAVEEGDGRGTRMGNGREGGGGRGAGAASVGRAVS